MIGGVTIKRKVIQIADSTQLVSLPRKWSLRNNVKKGDELEITDQGNRILVEADTDNINETKKKTINLDGMEPFLQYILYGLYQKGFTEVTFLYKDEETAQRLQQILHEKMIGFEVVEQTFNSCTIRAIAGALSSEFGLILKRAFKLNCSMFDGIIEIIETGNILPLKSLTYMEANIKKYTGFCKRMINKKLIHDEDITNLYIIVTRIERLSRNLRYLCFEIMRLPHIIKDLDPKIIQAFKDIQEFIKLAYEMYYNYEIKKVFKIFDKRNIIIKKAQVFTSKHKGEELRFVHYIFDIVTQVFELSKAKMEMEM